MLLQAAIAKPSLTFGVMPKKDQLSWIYVLTLTLEREKFIFERERELTILVTARNNPIKLNQLCTSSSTKSIPLSRLQNLL